MKCYYNKATKMQLFIKLSIKRLQCHYLGLVAN